VGVFYAYPASASVPASLPVPVPVTVAEHAGKPPQRECRVRNCAPTTNRPCDTSRTITLPGTPRVERSGTALPVQKEAAGARAAWSQTFPLPTHDHAARATLGYRDADRRPGVPEGRGSQNPRQRTAPHSRSMSTVLRGLGARHLRKTTIASSSGRNGLERPGLKESYPPPPPPGPFHYRPGRSDLDKGPGGGAGYTPHRGESCKSFPPPTGEPP